MKLQIEVTEIKVYRCGRGYRTDIVFFQTKLTSGMPSLASAPTSFKIEVAAESAESWLFKNFGLTEADYTIEKY